MQPGSIPTSTSSVGPKPIATTCYSGSITASSSTTSLEAEADPDMSLITTPTFSDMSNYLSTVSHDPNHMIKPPTTSDHHSFRYASPMEDIYGWDAELSRRKMPAAHMLTNSENGCEDLTITYRRANGSKANLLQRVFRVGSASSLSRYETPI